MDRPKRPVAGGCNIMDQDEYFYSVGKQDDDPCRVVEIKIRRSTFICSLAYASTMEKAKECISQVAKHHSAATHNCWAYIMGPAGEIYHSSDAGEPAGTAGKPILNTLNKYRMTCTAAVVTRYFGGVKLGIRGLIDAYCQSVEAAIEAAPLIRLVQTCSYQVHLAYDVNDLFLQQIKPFAPRIFHSDYMEAVTHYMEVDEVFSQDFEKMLMEYQAQGKIQYQSMDANAE